MLCFLNGNLLVLVGMLLFILLVCFLCFFIIVAIGSPINFIFFAKTVYVS